MILNNAMHQNYHITNFIILVNYKPPIFILSLKAQRKE